MARRFINVIGRARQVASAGTAASIFLKPLDFQDRLYRRGETPLHHHAPYSRSRLTDPAFAGSVSPSYGECQATEKRVSGFSSLESNEVAKFFSG